MCELVTGVQTCALPISRLAQGPCLSRLCRLAGMCDRRPPDRVQHAHKGALLQKSCSLSMLGGDWTDGTMTDFKWRHFQGDVILWAVRWYCRYPISYRDLEEMLAERGISVDHTTIYRWVQCYAPEMEKRLRWFWRRGFDPCWRLDETYVKVQIGRLCVVGGDWTVGTLTDVKWRHLQGDVILWSVRWYCRYPISYRDLEEMLAERGISVDHTTIYRWVQCYAPEMEKRLRWFWRRGFDPSWRLDETYVKVRGKWTYLYRAVDKRGATIDF